jgi:hypothetical protein
MFKILFFIHLIMATASSQTLNWGACPKEYMEGAGLVCSSCVWSCAIMKLPLDRGNPSGATVDSFVRRVTSSGSPTKTTMWGFPGGDIFYLVPIN